MPFMAPVRNASARGARSTEMVDDVRLDANCEAFSAVTPQASINRHSASPDSLWLRGAEGCSATGSEAAWWAGIFISWCFGIIIEPMSHPSAAAWDHERTSSERRDTNRCMTHDVPQFRDKSSVELLDVGGVVVEQSDLAGVAGRE